MSSIAEPASVPPFGGPLADGPLPAMLEVRVSRLNRVTPLEARRMVDVAAALAVGVGASSVRSLGRGLPTRARAAGAVSEGVVDAFERLGPTFVKLGQLFASSPMLVPDPLADAARRCLDQVTPVKSARILRIIEEDLGQPADEVFASFDPDPLSAGSIAQVHGCVLRDGRDAVVKVRRPGLGRRMNADLRVLHKVAKLVARSRRLNFANPVGVIEDLHRVTNEELNFVVEAHRQDRFRAHLHDFGDNDLVTAPEVYWDHCGPRVICMERLYGRPIDQFDGLVEKGFELVRYAIKAWMEAACIHGPFHGDMHAGNLWVLDDGRVGFLDFGIMGELTPPWRDALRTFMRATVVDQDFTSLVAQIKRLGVLPETMAEDVLGAQLGVALTPVTNTTITNVKVGETLQSALTLASQAGGAQTPAEMILIAKQLLYVERYLSKLAPEWAMFRDPWLMRNILPPEDLAQVLSPDRRN